LTWVRAAQFVINKFFIAGTWIRIKYLGRFLRNLATWGTLGVWICLITDWMGTSQSHLASWSHLNLCKHVYVLGAKKLNLNTSYKIKWHVNCVLFCPCIDGWTTTRWQDPSQKRSLIFISKSCKILFPYFLLSLPVLEQGSRESTKSISFFNFIIDLSILLEPQFCSNVSGNHIKHMATSPMKN